MAYWHHSRDVMEMTQQEVDETHPKFTIKCNECGSTRVIFSNSFGFSEMSGAWGSADLECLDCDNSSELISS